MRRPVRSSPLGFKQIIETGGISNSLSFNQEVFPGE
ncbi:hypothetical protein PSEG_05228 [Pseudomonas sp. Nvir]|jgi:hypothetical protein|nr:hypothetical protein PSNVIR_01165 [Pseudomonas sp. Nvir]SUD80701.1 homoserine O-acetyltransferase [Pseudomonas putida]